jgi:cell division protein FtsA
MAGEDITAKTNCSTVAISGSSNPISEEDRDRALIAAEQDHANLSQTVMHRFVQSYAVDGEPVQNPLWLHGNRLSVEMLTISASGNACTTLKHAASEADLEIAGFLLESVGAAHATLSHDERDMGVGLLDIGAGTCDLSLFCGSMRHLEEIPLGGEDITRDLSVVLSIPPREAEQLKRQFGSVNCQGDEGDQSVTYRTTAGRTCTMTRQQFSEIIEARQREIFEHVHRALADAPYNNHLSAGIVLTGGGAMLDQLAPLAEEVLGHHVRIGAPRDIIAPEALGNPSFAAAVGLLRFAADEHGEMREARSTEKTGSGFMNTLGKLLSFF